MLPEGWDTWLPPVNPKSGSAAAKMGGRRLAGQFNVRLLPETLQPMDEHGGKVTLTATTSRVLLADTQPSATSAPQSLKNCPHRVYHHSVHKNLTRSDNPTCQGAGFAAHQARMQQHRKAAAMRDRQCSVAIRNSTGRVISKLPFNSCVVRRTPRAELDARDEARRVAARASPSAGEPGDFFSKLTSLVQAICYYESKTNCDVDSQGTTDWYKRYFSVRCGYAVHWLLVVQRVPEFQLPLCERLLSIHRGLHVVHIACCACLNALSHAAPHAHTELSVCDGHGRSR